VALPLGSRAYCVSAVQLHSDSSRQIFVASDVPYSRNAESRVELFSAYTPKSRLVANEATHLGRPPWDAAKAYRATTSWRLHLLLMGAMQVANARSCIIALLHRMLTH